MPLNVSDRDNSDSATNRGPQAQTVQPLNDADDQMGVGAEGDADIRNFPSNGAIPDEVRQLIPSPSYHVP